jgi:hypothetical protein
MLNPFRWSFRAHYFTGFAVCAVFLAYAYYVQFQLGIEPCPLCIFQRFAFIAMALFFLIGAISDPRERGRRVFGLLVLLSACAGIAIAARHIWVQHLPPDPMAGCARAGTTWSRISDSRCDQEGIHRVGRLRRGHLGLPGTVDAVLDAGLLRPGRSGRPVGRPSPSGLTLPASRTNPSGQLPLAPCTHCGMMVFLQCSNRRNHEA